MFKLLRHWLVTSETPITVIYPEAIFQSVLGYAAFKAIARSADSPLLWADVVQAVVATGDEGDLADRLIQQAIASGILAPTNTWGQFQFLDPILQKQWAYRLYETALPYPAEKPHSLYKLTPAEYAHFQRHCIKFVGKLGYQEVLPTLLNYAQTPDRNFRWAAVDSLGYLGNAEAIPMLIHAAKEDEDGFVRGSAVLALAQVGGNAASHILYSLFENGFVGLIPKALWLAQGETAIPYLSQVLLSHPNQTTRRSIIRVFGENGGDAVLPALLHSLKHDDDTYVRGDAAEALGRIGHAEAIPPLCDALLNDIDTHVRVSAAGALGGLRAEIALTELQQALINDRSEYVRGASARALGQIGNKISLPNLRHAYQQDAKQFVQHSAIEALVQIGGIDIYPEFRHHLQANPNGLICGAIISGWGKFGGEASIPELRQILQTSQNSDVCRIAIRTLKQIGTLQAMTAIPKPDLIQSALYHSPYDENGNWFRISEY